MAKERTDSIYKNKNGNWFARVTFTCSNRKRKDIKRKAADKTKAKEIPKALLKQLADEGDNVVESSKMTFISLADQYDKNYLIPAEYKILEIIQQSSEYNKFAKQKSRVRVKRSLDFSVLILSEPSDCVPKL